MSNSLNQAFIKAYSKEQASLAKQRQQGTNSGLKVEDFIVRFDTATCVIPSLHPATSPLPNAGATASVPAASALPRSIALPRVVAATRGAVADPSATVEATVVNLARRFRSQSENAKSAATETERKSPAERRAAEELRSTIASQMSRAGTWEAQQIDAFGGGFPMISPFHQRRSHQQAASSPPSPTQPGPSQLKKPPAVQPPLATQPAVAEPQPQAGHIKGPHFNRTAAREKVVVARSAPVRAAEQHAIHRQPAPVEQLPRVRLTSLEDEMHATDWRATAPSQLTAGLRGDVGDNASESGLPADASPQLSPLESSALPRGDDSSQPSVRASQLSREARAQEQSGLGEIFRLDRPSYTQQAELAAPEDYSDSGDLSSEVLGLSASGTNVDIQSLFSNGLNSTRDGSGQKGRPDTVGRKEDLEPESPSYQSAGTAAARSSAKFLEDTFSGDTATRDWPAKSLERDLRKAKVRIFNPVWEVDSFQWPDICIELLQQRAEAMEMVARNLTEACQEGLQVLAVTSPQSGDGRTTVACCLAKLAGSRGLNVAIVDGDIENPTLSFQTNLELEQDWKTAIFNQLPLEEVAVHSIGDQVTLVPLVRPIASDEMATDDNRIEFMLQELSASFDLVIVDMGHMDSSRSLVTSLGERGVISAVVAVVDYRSSTRQQVDSCLHRLRQTGIASIGLVENFAA